MPLETQKDRDQKNRELKYFSKFKEHSAFMLERETLQLSPPEPDIVVNMGVEKLGIEITEFYRTVGSLKRNESEQQRVLALAQSFYESQDKPPVCVGIFWNPHTSTTKRERTKIANQIAEVVIKYLPSAGTKIEIEQDGEPSCPLPEAIDIINIDRSFEYKSCLWYTPRGDFLWHCSINELQSLITKKNLLYENYTGICSELWLLIVAEELTPSSWCELPDETRLHGYNTIFGRIFFLHMLSPKIIELSKA